MKKPQPKKQAAAIEVENLQAVMDRFSISVNEAAAIVGTVRQNIYNWINGDRAPSRLWREKIRLAVSKIERDYGAPTPSLTHIYHRAVWPHMSGEERQAIVELLGDPDHERRVIESYKRLAAEKKIKVELPAVIQSRKGGKQ